MASLPLMDSIIRPPVNLAIHTGREPGHRRELGGLAPGRRELEAGPRHESSKCST